MAVLQDRLLQRLAREQDEAPGVGFALGASFAFAIILFQTTRRMKAAGGRMRSFIGMSVVGECRWRSASSPAAFRCRATAPAGSGSPC